MFYRQAAANTLDWDQIRHFSITEWGGLSRINSVSALLVQSLDEFRQALKAPVYISPRTWGKHTPRSYHYADTHGNAHCWAIDIFCACPLAWSYYMAMSMPIWGGIGVYPYWSYPDKKLRGGLHLDIRTFQDTRTVWYQDKNGTYNYIHSYEELAEMIVEMFMS
jgi:hypothetical protein